MIQLILLRLKKYESLTFCFSFQRFQSTPTCLLLPSLNLGLTSLRKLKQSWGFLQLCSTSSHSPGFLYVDSVSHYVEPALLLTKVSWPVHQIPFSLLHYHFSNSVLSLKIPPHPMLLVFLFPCWILCLRVPCWFFFFPTSSCWTQILDFFSSFSLLIPPVIHSGLKAVDMVYILMTLRFMSLAQTSTPATRFVHPVAQATFH